MGFARMAGHLRRPISHFTFVE